MTGEVIKSFLVGLGFDVDDASLTKFNKAISNATLKVAALYGATKLAATAIVYGISQISEGFEKMGYEYRIIAPAINKALALRRELLKAYSAAGINITRVVQESVKLNFSLAKTKFAFEAIYRSVASKFFPLITKQSDLLRQKLYQNLPKIQEVLERLVNFVFKAFEATTALGLRLWSILTRVYDFFAALDRATNGWSTAVLALVAAWKFLNLAFIATPLGLLITGFTALLTLWDDFKTFREGGQSLINWGSEATKIIIGLTTAVAALSAALIFEAAAYGILSNAGKVYAAVQAVVNAVMLANPIGLILAGVTALIGLLALLDAKWSTFGGHVSGFFSSLGGRVLDFLAGGTQNATAITGPSAPIGVGGNQNNASSHSIQQQTQINVTGSADANAVGKSVAGEQNRVNFDMARNLKGATR